MTTDWNIDNQIMVFFEYIFKSKFNTHYSYILITINRQENPNIYRIYMTDQPIGVGIN